MYKSFIIFYKYIDIYSDGSVSISYLNLNQKKNKKLTIYKKDHKLFQKLSKNTSLLKKTNNYRNKIF